MKIAIINQPWSYVLPPVRYCQPGGRLSWLATVMDQLLATGNELFR
jgi:hypothetical protein